MGAPRAQPIDAPQREPIGIPTGDDPASQQLPGPDEIAYLERLDEPTLARLGELS